MLFDNNNNNIHYQKKGYVWWFIEYLCKCGVLYK